MPELPEVETTRRGIEPWLRGCRITGVEVREPRLRWPVPSDLGSRVSNQRVRAVRRRAKYLLLDVAHGSVIVHLGMSGSLRVVDAHVPPEKFDHLDLCLEHGRRLRLRDPRRFGAVLWTAEPDRHPLLAHLGPEPLDGLTADHLYKASRGRTRAVKDFLMDGRVVAGIGNIYANEALFLAGIDPRRPAGRISRARYADLRVALTRVLTQALTAGGTTLRDFRAADGSPGYFKQSLRVYGRKGLRCPRCAGPVRQVVVGQRSAFFCGRCQR